MAPVTDDELLPTDWSIGGSGFRQWRLGWFARGLQDYTDWQGLSPGPVANAKRSSRETAIAGVVAGCSRLAAATQSSQT